MNVPVETIILQEGTTVIQLPANDVVSTLNLSCTVTNEGLFQFQWTLPDMTTIDSTWVADGSRTGILQVSGLRGNGEMEYVCQADYVSGGLPTGASPSPSSRTMTLNFQGNVNVCVYVWLYQMVIGVNLSEPHTSKSTICHYSTVQSSLFVQYISFSMCSRLTAYV